MTKAYTMCIGERRRRELVYLKAVRSTFELVSTPNFLSLLLRWIQMTNLFHPASLYLLEEAQSQFRCQSKSACSNTRLEFLTVQFTFADGSRTGLIRDLAIELQCSNGTWHYFCQCELAGGLSMFTVPSCDTFLTLSDTVRIYVCKDLHVLVRT